MTESEIEFQNKGLLLGMVMSGTFVKQKKSIFQVHLVETHEVVSGEMKGLTVRPNVDVGTMMKI